MAYPRSPQEVVDEVIAHMERTRRALSPNQILREDSQRPALHSVSIHRDGTVDVEENDGELRKLYANNPRAHSLMLNGIITACQSMLDTAADHQYFTENVDAFTVAYHSRIEGYGLPTYIYHVNGSGKLVSSD